MTCPACGSELSFFMERRLEMGFSTEFETKTYRLCRSCGLVWKDELPSEDELRRYYESSWQASSDRPERCYSSAAEWIASILRTHKLPLGRTAADVGSRSIALMESVSALVKLSEYSVMDAHPGPMSTTKWLGSGNQSSCEYSLVTSTHVLEHVLDPKRFIGDLLEMVSPGVLLYIEVPALEGGGGYEADDIHRTHLRHYSAPALASETIGLAQVVGLETDISVQGWPVNRIMLRRPDTSGEESSYGEMFRKQANKQDNAMIAAAKRIESMPSAVLYGACEGLMRVFAFATGLGVDIKNPIADKHKAGGEFLGLKILSPEEAIKPESEVLICTNNTNSIHDTESFLSSSFPDCRHSRLFA